MNTPLSSSRRFTASRRDVLKTIAGAGALSYFSADKMSAQTNPRRIDVHHHFNAAGRRQLPG